MVDAGWRAAALLLLSGLLLSACAPAKHVAALPAATVTAHSTLTAPAPALTAPTRTVAASDLPPQPATPTPIPTSTASATPTVTPSPPPTPTPTPIGSCSARIPSDDDLHVLVSETYAISRDYQPADLVPLADYFDRDVTLGFPGEIRAIIVEPLLALITDMRAVGLQPQILSGYRSYSAQAAAYSKWLRAEPERVGILSARPGHSEHQLGTTVDFGSPELAEIVGNPAIEFHTYFYLTNEGAWLATNAHRYGFTLSYSRDSFEDSGIYFEPWHFRYVGVALATLLYEQDLTLTQYLLQSEPPPCIPEP